MDLNKAPNGHSPHGKAAGAGGKGNGPCQEKGERGRAKPSIPKSLDSIDMTILAHMHESCASFFTAQTVIAAYMTLEDVMGQGISLRTFKRRIANLKKRGFIAEGIKTCREKGYHMTEKGVRFLDELKPGSESLANT